MKTASTQVHRPKSQSPIISFLDDGSSFSHLKVPGVTQKLKRSLNRVCSVLLLGMQCGAHAGMITEWLSWDPKPAGDSRTGITVHYGNASGKYSKSFDVGDVTTTSITLSPGNWYIALTAFNDLKERSDYSNEVSISYVPATPTNFGFKGAQILQEGFNHKEPKNKVIRSGQFGNPVDVVGVGRGIDVVKVPSASSVNFSCANPKETGKGASVLSSLSMPPAVKVVMFANK